MAGLRVGVLMKEWRTRYAPRYTETPIGEKAMSRVQQSVQRLLDSHDPYLGVAVDRQWNVVLANQAGY